MARLESIDFRPHRPEVAAGKVFWHPHIAGKPLSGLPQIFWATHSPWREPNLWFAEAAFCRDVHLRTVQTRAACLLGYAKWLEQTETDWRDFPARKELRCLIRYRGALVEARNTGELAASTVAQRMRVIVAFYRWAKANGLLSPPWPTWHERKVKIHTTNQFGLQRTLAKTTTDLAIPYRAAPGMQLEDGLQPVSATDRNNILNFARIHASRELYLMLTTAFFTGVRLQTLADLKVDTLLRAGPDPSSDTLYRLAVGPAASPPVSTKFNVTGHIWIPHQLLQALIEYAHSERRLKRAARANYPGNRELLFLTRFGNPYAARGVDKSASMNVELHGLRQRAEIHGVAYLRGFRFHQTRCTFATELARNAVSVGGAIHAIALVKEALLHRKESTSLKYIKFVERTPIMAEVANEFTRAFLGLSSGAAHAAT